MAKMKIVELAGFDEFVENYPTYFPKPVPDSDGSIHAFSDIVFRGQSKANWELTTTLERYGVSDCRVSNYMDYVLRCSSEFASYTGRQMRTDTRSYMLKEWNDVQGTEQLFNFTVELRHFGFPSPLLDWTTSPYIAAYFAYRDQSGDDPVAIYSLQETVGQGKGGWRHEPRIYGVGPYIETTDRHHIQQAQYTVCLRVEQERDFFVQHDAGFEASEDHQDILVKFVLPPGIRHKVLDQLQLMNINEYTLFRSPEGLCHHLAHKHIRDR